MEVSCLKSVGPLTWDVAVGFQGIEFCFRGIMGVVTNRTIYELIIPSLGAQVHMVK